MREKEREKRGSFWVNTRGANVEKIGGSTKGFSPEFGRHGGLYKESSNYVIDGTERSFCLAILWRCIWTRKAKKNTVL